MSQVDLSTLRAPVLHTIALSITGIRDVACLNGCRNLTNIDISNTNVTDAGLISLHALFPGLRILSVEMCQSVYCLKEIAKCARLTGLNFGGTNVTDLSGLPQSLRHLIIRKCKLLAAEHAVLHINSLPRLESLDTDIAGAKASAVCVVATRMKRCRSECGGATRLGDEFGIRVMPLDSFCQAVEESHQTLTHIYLGKKCVHFTSSSVVARRLF